jgi:hypothetical protein
LLDTRGKEQETQQQHHLDVMVIDRAGAEMNQGWSRQRGQGHAGQLRDVSIGAIGHPFGDCRDQKQGGAEKQRRP